MKRIVIAVILASLFGVSRAEAQSTYGVVSVGSSATLVHATQSARRNIWFFNNGSATMYCGFDSSVTTSNGMPFLTMTGGTSEGDGVAFQSQLYCIVATGTTDVRWWETTR